MYLGGQQTDRVLRPMIVAKQLDLPESQIDVPSQTPRTDLVRQLDKYNRPEAQRWNSLSPNHGQVLIKNCQMIVIVYA